MLIKTMKLRLDELALYMALDLGGFLFGSLVLALVTYFERGESDFTVFRMGTAMALILFCMLAAMLGIFGMGGYFNWHVGFGRTRKSFFICDIITELCWYMFSLLVIWGLSVAEGGILKLFYSPYEESLKEMWEIWGIRILWIIPVLALVMVIVRELMGTLLMRFGNKAFWIMWGLWMFICLVPGRIEYDRNGVAAEMSEKIMTQIKEISMTGWAVIGTVCAILMLAVSWLLMRKQMVKS